MLACVLMVHSTRVWFTLFTVGHWWRPTGGQQAKRDIKREKVVHVLHPKRGHIQRRFLAMKMCLSKKKERDPCLSGRRRQWWQLYLLPNWARNVKPPVVRDTPVSFDIIYHPACNLALAAHRDAASGHLYLRISSTIGAMQMGRWKKKKNKFSCSLIIWNWKGMCFFKALLTISFDATPTFP